MERWFSPQTTIPLVTLQTEYLEAKTQTGREERMVHGIWGVVYRWLPDFSRGLTVNCFGTTDVQ